MAHFRQKRSCKKGSILVFSLILMSIVLVSAISVMSTTIIGQNIAAVTDDSTIAFQAADSGAEQAFLEFRKNRIAILNQFSGGTCSGGVVTVNNLGINSRASYELLFYDADGAQVGDCAVSTDTIQSAKSIGYYGKAIRAVEIAVSIPSDNITNGLVAHWPFDMEASRDFEDVVSSYNGTTSGGATTTSAGTVPVGSGVLLLDGVDDFVRIPLSSSSALNFADNEDYTISLWAYIDTTANRQSALFRNSGYSLFYDNGGSEWEYQGIDSNTSVSSGQWYHIVLWQSGSTGTRGIYVNGTLAQDGASFDSDNSNDIFFGVQDDGVIRKSYFGGKIDDVRIYDRALDLTEILILCENNFDGNTPVSGVSCG